MYAHKHPEPTDPRVGPAIVYLIVGLPGAGKQLTRRNWRSARRPYG